MPLVFVSSNRQAGSPQDFSSSDEPFSHVVWNDGGFKPFFLITPVEFDTFAHTVDNSGEFKPYATVMSVESESFGISASGTVPPVSAQYTFENNLLDSSTNNNTLTYTTAPTFSTAIKKVGNYSVKLGANTKLISSKPFTVSNRDFTVEAWVYVEQSDTTILLIDFFKAANLPAFRVYLNAGAVRYVSTDGSGVNTMLLDDPAVLPKNQWAHIAVSRSKGVSKLFVNGIQKAQGPDPYEFPELVMALGFYPAGGTSNPYPFTGYMDDVKITVGAGLYTQNFIP